MNIGKINPLEKQNEAHPKYYLMKNNDIKLIDVLSLIDGIRDFKSAEWRHPKLCIFGDGSLPKTRPSNNYLRPRSGNKNYENIHS